MPSPNTPQPDDSDDGKNPAEKPEEKKSRIDTNGDIWTGNFDESLSGKGKVEIKEEGPLKGATFEGTFENSSMSNGLCIQTFPDGDRFETIYENGVGISAKLIKVDGTILMGTCSKVQRDGNPAGVTFDGIIIYPDGYTAVINEDKSKLLPWTERKTAHETTQLTLTTTFGGEIEETIQGTDIIASGSERYIGYFDENFTGKGAKMTDNDIFIGKFVNGRHTEGRKYHFENGECVEEERGEWSATGQFTGLRTDENGSTWKVENDINVGSPDSPIQGDTTIQYAPTPPEKPKHDVGPHQSSDLSDSDEIIVSQARTTQELANRYLQYARIMLEKKNTYKRPSIAEIGSFMGVSVRQLTGPDLQYCIGIDIKYNGENWIMVLPNLNIIRSARFSEGIFRHVPDAGANGLPAKFILIKPDGSGGQIFDIKKQKEEPKKKLPKQKPKPAPEPEQEHEPEPVQEPAPKHKITYTRRSKNVESTSGMRINLLGEEEMKKNRSGTFLEAREKLTDIFGAIGQLIKSNRKKLIVVLGALGAAAAMYSHYTGKTPTPSSSSIEASEEVPQDTSSPPKVGEVITFDTIKEAIDGGYMYKTEDGEYKASEGYELFEGEEIGVKRIK